MRLGHRGLLPVALATVGSVVATLLGASPAAAAPASDPTVAGVPVPAGVTASYAVYDRRAQRFTITHNPHRPFRSASVVKLLIALDYLTQHHPGLDLEKATTDEQRLEILALRTMLRGSWDWAASVFWVKDGFTDVVTRMTEQLGLTETTAPANPKFWGYTMTTASDIVKVYNFILDRAPAQYRQFILDNLHAATRCAEDGYDQSFGIPAAYPHPYAVKQGWSGWPSTVPEAERCAESMPNPLSLSGYGGRLPASKEDPQQPDLASPLLHSTGIVGGERTVVVLLTTYPPKTSWRQAAGVISGLARRLAPYVPGLGTGNRASRPARDATTVLADHRPRSEVVSDRPRRHHTPGPPPGEHRFNQHRANQHRGHAPVRVPRPHALERTVLGKPRHPSKHSPRSRSHSLTGSLGLGR